MKTTTTTTATTRSRRPPCRTLKRPAHLDGTVPRVLTSASCRAMLSFLARLSGRRRRWRHARSPRRPGAGAAGARARARAVSSMPEADETSCARCRAQSACSCELLGLDGPREQQAPHCRRARHPRRRRAAAEAGRGCARRAAAVLRRRPPEAGWRASCLAATLLILSTGLISCAEACSSRSTPKPRPPAPTPRPNITFHMFTCPPDYAEWYCLNGATCFTVKIVESLLYNCLCANGYIGQRCEFKDLDGSYLPSRQRIMLETASIAGAVTIAVVLAVITFISVYIHCKRKQKELRMKSNGNGVDAVDGLPRDPELRPFCSRSRSLMIFMAKNPNNSTTPPIEHTRMPSWNYQPSCPAEASARMASVNESKRPSQ
ncbi:uncharacterized protein LOC131666147 [Phymastichus coffea]|uniref:uncharacterized protein LOC131666147 n=1 Tax=Phymastichus coffea TaxID=108790 RepID=UPI00273AB05B|nr:uncharacterized protein LOC131666147 [Phymastichus coffea]